MILHIHWYRYKDDTAYKMCRCGHRKLVPLGEGFKGAIVLPVQAYDPLHPSDVMSIHDDDAH